MPAEWRDLITARFALDHIALNPSTPLPVQADYMASLVGGCLAGFFITLLVFSVGETKVVGSSLQFWWYAWHRQSKAR